MGTPNILNTRSGIVYTILGTAVANALPGDTLEVTGGIGGATTTYFMADVAISINLTVNVVGDAGSAIFTPGSSVVAKGIVVLGVSGTFPNVSFSGVHFTGAAASLNKTGSTINAWGLSIPAGAPNQLADGNGAGIRYQSGNLTLTNCVIDYCQDGILSQPFIWGTGSISMSNCTVRYCGTGIGQQHNLYIGRIALFSATGLTSDHSIAGQCLKSRAVSTVINAGCSFGSIDPGDFSNNALQTPDGGSLMIADGTAFGRGRGAQNPFLIEIGGVVPPWAGATFSVGSLMISDQSLGTAGANSTQSYVWNFTNIPVALGGLTITGPAGATVPGILNGMGSWSGVTFNGTAVADGSGSHFPALVNVSISRVIDLTGTSTPQTVTNPSHTDIILGGSGLLTVSGGDAAEVVAGPGGVSATDAGYFIDAVGDAPSSLSGAPIAQFLYATGDISTPSSNAGGYVLACGVNQQVNWVSGAKGFTEVKASALGTVPTCSYQNGSGDVYIDAGGTVTVGGSGSIRAVGMSALPGGVPASFIVDNYLNTYTGTFSGQAFEVDLYTTASPSRIISYSDASHLNVFEPGSGSWEVDYIQNDTLVLGSSSGIVATTPPGVAGPLLLPAAVIGTGSASLSLNGPALMQVMPASTGTLNVSNYSPSHAAGAPVILMGGVTAKDAISGGNRVVTCSTGARIVMLGETGAINYSAPAGASDAVLMTPSLSVQPGTTVLLGASVSDTWASSHPGLGILTLDALYGGTLSLISATGSPAQLASELAGVTYTAGYGSSDEVVITWQNQGGVITTGTVHVSYDVVLTIGETITAALLSDLAGSSWLAGAVQNGALTLTRE